MSADYEALAALAEAATPGPWTHEFIDEDGYGWTVAVGDAGVVATVGEVDACEADAAFIAAANPTTVLALIADLRTARRAVWASEEIDRRAGMLAGVTAERDAEKARADAAEAEVERLRAQGIADLAVAAESIRLLTDQRDAAEAAVARVQAVVDRYKDADERFAPPSGQVVAAKVDNAIHRRALDGAES